MAQQMWPLIEEYSRCQLVAFQERNQESIYPDFSLQPHSNLYLGSLFGQIPSTHGMMQSSEVSLLVHRGGGE